VRLYKERMTEGWAEGWSEATARATPNLLPSIFARNPLARRRSNTVFDGTTLVSNHEPCTMCFTTLVNVGVSKIVFTGKDTLNGGVSVGLGNCVEVSRGSDGSIYYELTEGIGGSTFHFKPTIVYVPFSLVAEWWGEHCEREGIQEREEWRGWFNGRGEDENLLKGWWRERRKRR